MTIGATGTAQGLTAQQQQQLLAQQQQQAAASQQAAAAQPAAPAGGILSGILGMMKVRVKPIDQQFVVGLAEAMQAQQIQIMQLQALAASAAAQNEAGQSLTPGQGSSGSADAGEGAASLLPQQATTAQQAAAQASSQQAAAARAAVTETRSTAYAAPTSATPKRYDAWTAHIAQFRGKYLPDGPTMRPNCGPASVTMALRLAGLDVPGFNGQKTEAVLDQARIIATGTNNVNVGTTDTELERVISAAGGQYSETTDFNQIKQWAKQGTPVILAGNPIYGWDRRYSNDQVYNFDGGHWVTVSGYDSQTGLYIVNDPLSQIGPIEVSEQELYQYTSHNSGLGIAVYK